MKKIVSVLSLVMVFGCQKQIQLSNGKVIYQPYGSNNTIQAQQYNNSGSQNSDSSSSGSSGGLSNLLGATGALATPVAAGAVLGAEAIGNTAGSGVANMANIAGSGVSAGSSLMQNGASNGAGGANDLESAINQSFGKTQNSANINDGISGANSGVSGTNTNAQYNQSYNQQSAQTGYNNYGNNGANGYGNNVNSYNNGNAYNNVNSYNNGNAYNSVNTATQNSAMNYSNSGVNNGYNSYNNVNSTTNASQSVSSVSQAVPQNYTLQVGNYTNANTANKIVKELQSQGFDAQIVKVGSSNKIVVGDYATKVAGESTKANLKALGYVGTFFTQLSE